MSSNSSQPFGCRVFVRVQRLALAVALLFFAFVAQAQNAVVCSGDQFKVFGWGGVAWEAASANCGGGVYQYPTLDAWQGNVQATCLASWGAANLQWGAVRHCNVSDTTCGVGINGYQMELFFDHPQGYRADDRGAAEVAEQCIRGYYVAVPQPAAPSTGNPCSECSKGLGQRAPTGDPADLSSGNEYQEAEDFQSGDGRMVLRRSYNSRSLRKTSLGEKWMFGYESRVLPLWGSVKSSYYSSIYTSPGDACYSGWSQIAAAAKEVWPDTAGATVTFSNGTEGCVLSTGRHLPLSYSSNSASSVAKSTLALNPQTDWLSTVSYMAVSRADGAVYQFTCQDSKCKPNANISLRLEVMDGGFVVKDDAGRVERYDANGKPTSITERDGYRQDLIYGRDQLISVVDSSDRRMTFTYAGDLVSSVTLPDGGVVAYTYSDSGELTTVTYPDQSSIAYEYQAGLPHGLLTSITDEASNPYLTISYDADGRSLGDFRAGGVEQTTIIYPDANTAQATDSLGVVRKYHFGSVQGARLLTSIDGPKCRDCMGSSVTYDVNGYPELVAGFNGDSKRYSYDATGLLLSVAEAVDTPIQRTHKSEWDALLRRPTTSELRAADGSLVAKQGFAYDAAGRLTAHCDLDVNAASAIAYLCSPSATPPESVRRWIYVYCEVVDAAACPRAGLLLSVDGPIPGAVDVTHYVYYSSADEAGCGAFAGPCHKAGDLLSTTDPAGLVTTAVAYDKAGRIVRSRAPNGVLTDYTYTARGWLSTTTVRALLSGQASTGDATTRIDYDPTGLVHKLTDPDGVTVTYTYDAAHRLTDITDGGGRRYHYVLDAAGNRLKEQVITEAGTVVRTTAQTFNSLGQLTRITDGLGRTVFSAGSADSYDGNGNLVHGIDGLGVQEKHVFDALDRLVSTLKDYQGANGATANSQSVTSFDAMDRPTGFSDPDGLNTTYDFDAFGNLTGLNSPDTGATSHTFDLAGNLTRSTDATDVTHTSTYDADNRLTAKTYQDTSLNVQYKYDEADSVTGCSGGFAAGHLTRIVEGTGGIVWCYDNRGNVVRKQQTVGTETRTTTYAWTAANRLKSVVTPNGTLIAYGRNALGQVTSVQATPQGGTTTSVVSAAVYKSFGPLASYKLADGQTVTLTYDAAGALTDITSAAFSLHVKRDVLGNIVAIGDTAGVTSPSETYTYDALYRLTGVKAAAGSSVETYTYNKTGDRLSKAAPGLLTGSYSYADGSHHLVGIGSSSREVDARGNTITSTLASGTFSYEYNQRNRLATVRSGGVIVGAYVFNALGQRVQKVADGATTRFDYDESNQLLSESNGSIARDYIWMDGIPVGLVDRSGTSVSLFAVHSDELGSPRAVTNSAGSVIWQWAYRSNPFGEVSPASSTGYRLNMRFPGQYFDAESGLIHNVSRDYEAATGRYVQSDPLGISAGASTYGYVSNNPFTAADPLGLFITTVDATCAQDPKFCAEIFGDISRSEGAIQKKLGDPCAELRADAAADLLDSLGNIAAVLPVVPNLERLPRFNGPKPRYHVNDAHVPGRRGFNPGKTPIPADAEEVFANAVPRRADDPSAWFGKNSEGVIYRYSSANDGTAHFSGIAGSGSDTRNLTNYARDRLNGL